MIKIYQNADTYFLRDDFDPGKVRQIIIWTIIIWTMKGFSG